MQKEFSICNEVFGSCKSLSEWRRICEFVASCGYRGIEIAPFTLAESVEEIDSARRRQIRQIATGCGLQIIALHWLFAGRPGLHLNARDDSVRRQTVRYLQSLIHFAGDVGTGIMIFGSPQQRRVEDDLDAAWARTTDSIASVLPTLVERGVTLCQEALPPDECNFINSTGEAKRMVDRIGHANFRLMLDVKSMSAEAVSTSRLISEFGAQSAHIHLNDANRRAPGYGETDFFAIARAIEASGYNGALSIEPFDYSPSPELLAKETLAYLQKAFAA